jgi:hypothetical protein
LQIVFSKKLFELKFCNLENFSFYFTLISHGQFAAIEDLECSPSKATGYVAILEKKSVDLKKSLYFGPRHHCLAKIWPSSRFGLAMTDFNILCFLLQ